MISKKDKAFKYLVVAAIALTITAFIVASLYIWNITPRPYSTVILHNGEVYFGRLSYFPKLKLSDAYILQVVPDPNNPEQAVQQIVPLDLLRWSPEALVLNRDYVVSISEVSEESEVMQLIRSRSAAQ